MKINRNNYEAFLIDYLDGTLDAVLEAELLLFLKENPEIREEMNGLEEVSIESQSIRFTEKSLLKKTEIKTIAGIGEENFADYFIAFYENDLSDVQQSNLDKFLEANPQLDNEFKLHGKLLLQAESNTIYTEKEELKKKPAVAIWWISGTGIAAAIALLFALFNLMKPTEITRQQQQVAIVHLSPKTEIDIFTVKASLNLSDRKTSEVSHLIKTEEPFENENFSLARLESKTVATGLNETFEGIRLKQRLVDTEYLIASTSTPPPKGKKRGALGRVLHHNLKLLAQRFPKKDRSKSTDPTFVKILGGGITAFNTVTGSEVEMVKEYDKDGRLKAYQIDGEMLNVNRTLPDSGNTE